MRTGKWNLSNGFFELDLIVGVGLFALVLPALFAAFFTLAGRISALESQELHLIEIQNQLSDCRVGMISTQFTQSAHSASMIRLSVDLHPGRSVVLMVPTNGQSLAQ